MHIGLPGTGLAGLFYLLAALWMPCHELGRTLRGERDAARWHRALAQAGLALGIIAAIAATAWAFGLLSPAHSAPTTGTAAADASDAARSPADAIRLLGVAPGVLALGTLAVIVLPLEVVGRVLARRASRAAPRTR